MTSLLAIMSTCAYNLFSGDLSAEKAYFWQVSRTIFSSLSSRIGRITSIVIPGIQHRGSLLTFAHRPNLSCAPSGEPPPVPDLRLLSVAAGRRGARAGPQLPRAGTGAPGESAGEAQGGGRRGKASPGSRRASYQGRTPPSGPSVQRPDWRRPGHPESGPLLESVMQQAENFCKNLRVRGVCSVLSSRKDVCTCVRVSTDTVAAQLHALSVVINASETSK